MSVILVAYQRRGPVRRAQRRAAVERVGAYYGSWTELTRHRSVERGSIGLHLWDGADQPCGVWPVWTEHGRLTAAIPYPPLGYERVVSEMEPLRAAHQLPQALVAAPERIESLTPPFSAAVLDREGLGTLHLFTDVPGIGRLYELRSEEGRFFSNRPAAVLLFAGVPAAPSRNGWRALAAADWTMGDTTAYEGVRRVRGGMHILLGGDGSTIRQKRIRAVDGWARAHVRADAATVDAEAAADSLRATAQSIIRLWPGTISADLSGGRDSRLVAAALLAAGAEVRFNTHDAVPGETERAQQLVAALDRPVEHELRTRALTGAEESSIRLVDNARAWHRFSEGQRTSTYLWLSPPTTLTATSALIIGGAGGELAHEFYYTPDDLAAATDEPEQLLDWARAILVRRVIALGGLTPRPQRFARSVIDRVTTTAGEAGLRDATMLDYFYADERLRRWGMTGERPGIVSPLLSPGFVTACFALTPEQRLGSVLHTAVIDRMVPQWRGIPYFHGDPARPPRTPRAGSAADAELVGDIVSMPELWRADFVRKRIVRAWESSREGTSSNTQELMLRRVIWRATFADHLADLNRVITEPPRRARITLRRARQEPMTGSIG